MTVEDLREQAHNLDVTVWVGKAGLESVTDELANQLETRELVKVKFLRSAISGDDIETLATELANQIDATVIETRGHTAVYH